MPDDIVIRIQEQFDRRRSLVGYATVPKDILIDANAEIKRLRIIEQRYNADHADDRYDPMG